jgi:hypothetical protein
VVLERAEQVAAAFSAEVLGLAERAPAGVELQRLDRIAAIERRIVIDLLAHERVVERPGFAAEEVHDVAGQEVDHELHAARIDAGVAHRERVEVAVGVEVVQTIADRPRAQLITRFVRLAQAQLGAEARAVALIGRARERRVLGPVHELDAIDHTLALSLEDRRDAFEQAVGFDRLRGLCGDLEHRALTRRQ